MKVTITGRRGGKKEVNVRTLPQLEEALKRVPSGYDRKHEQTMLLGAFIADQLVEIRDALHAQAPLSARPKHRRVQTDWQRFFAAGMKAGKSPALIGAEWSERKLRQAS